MRLIKAKFNSVCAETGVKLPKGINMYYDYSTRKCYSLDSQAANKVNSEADSTRAYVEAQESAYWDNLTGGYYSR